MLSNSNMSNKIPPPVKRTGRGFCLFVKIFLSQELDDEGNADGAGDDIRRGLGHLDHGKSKERNADEQQGNRNSAEQGRRWR